MLLFIFFFFQAEDGIRDLIVTGVQTCALPISIGGFPQLLERPLSYLSDAFPRHTHQRPDLLEGHGLAALLEAVIEIENLALAGGQVYLEDAVDELTLQLAVGLLLDLAALLAGEALPQRGRV